VQLFDRDSDCSAASFYLAAARPSRENSSVTIQNQVAAANNYTGLPDSTVDAGIEERVVTQTTRTALVWCSAGSASGGMERIAISIANGLAGCGWRVVLVGPFRRAQVLLDLIRPEVVFYDHQPAKTALGLWRTMRFLQRVARHERVDVISAHGSLFPLIFTRVPVVWTEHDMRYGGPMLRGFRGLAWRLIRRRLRKGWWRAVTVSHHVKSCLRQNLEITEVPRVIYNGLPHAQALRALPPPRMTAPYQIGFIGRLTPIKRPMESFELSAMLNEMGVSHEWSIFGDGELMGELQATAAGRTGHSVRLCGLARNPQDAFARIDILCFLSRGEQEGLGMVLLEAMTANRPVVAWDTGCIGEVLANRGTLVPTPFSLSRYAETVAAVLRNERGWNAYEDRRWDESRMIGEYHEVLSEVVDERRRSA
jgi:glycosyltransferase involved in cell wall biosynthesis